MFSRPNREIMESFSFGGVWATGVSRNVSTPPPLFLLTRKYKKKNCRKEKSIVPKVPRECVRTSIGSETNFWVTCLNYVQGQ